MRDNNPSQRWISYHNENKPERPFSDPEELAYYNKIRKEMDDMRKEPVKKGIPLNWVTPEGMGK